jgi:hypothetical protein
MSRGMTFGNREGGSMRLQSILGVGLAVFFVSASSTAVSQAVWAGNRGGTWFSAGAGVSFFDPDYSYSGPAYGRGEMLGPTVWVDCYPQPLWHYLSGFGFEVEMRDITFHRSPSQPSNLREVTAGGGVLYTWLHFARIHPYGKFLVEQGNAEYESPAGQRLHANRPITAEGGGVEYKVSRHIWARADFEYQRWLGFFYTLPGAPAPSMSPEGFTIGAVYHFRTRTQ